ncbi:MAG: gliding motility-associated C-terminal domain-containing protein [Flavobacteriia bacterium]|jgi:gliding motility-associated-like protein
MKINILKLLFLFFVAFNFGKVEAQGNIPTVGTDFWLGFLSNYSGSSESLDLFLSGNEATSGTVSSPLQGWSTTFNITPGQTTTITIPEWIGGNYVDDAVSMKGLHIESNDTISVFAINFRSYTADGTLVLPKKALGTEYIISSFEGLYGESEFVVVATEDGTEVEITPSDPTTGGHAAGVPYIVQLDAGETYQVKSAVGNDLTGTKIVGTTASGDCRPFAVFSGVVCANIPTSCTACDHIYDQNYSIDTWGQKYYIPPFLNASTYTFRIIARDNNTTVTLDNGSQINLNAGQFVNYSSVPDDQVISADKPIAVIQYMEGITCTGSGDPAMLILNSEERKINEVTFSTVTSTIITNHTVNIIVETASTSSVLLDGVLINSSQFTTFGSDPLKSFARINIAQGSHNLNLPSGFTAYSYGTGDAESYAYGVGSFSPEAEIPIDTAYCSNDSVVLSAGLGLFNPWWATSTNPTDTIHEGTVLVLHPPIINDVYVVTGNSLVSGCVDVKYYSVESPNPPVLDVTISEDTVCKFSDVQFNLTITPFSSTYNVNWEPAYMFDDPHALNPVLNAQQSGWYKVTVSTMSGCGEATDSAYVEVLGGGVKDLIVTSDLATLCVPDTAHLNLEILQVIEFDDFSGGNNPNLWSNVSGSMNTDTCSVIAGDALYFYDATPRIAETVDFDMTNGGQIEFYLEIANGVAPCENADFGENVVLEYSTNGGVSWNNIATYFENAYPNFTLVNVQIPVAAQTSATRFRWRQLSFTAIDQDVWMLENVSISGFNSNGVTISWTPSASLSNSSIDNPLAFPTVPTWYVAEVAAGTCIYKDSVYINAGNAFTLNTTNDISLCTAIPLTLSAVPSIPGNFTYSWTPNVDLSANNTQSVNTTTASSTMYYVTVTSDFGCQAIDSVSIYFASQMTSTIIGDTSICEGDTSNLELQMSSNLTDDFNTVFNTELWSTIGGGLLNTSCGSVSGNALHFNSAGGTRYAQTVAMNTTSGGTISFSLIIGSGSSPCEDADSGEDIILEYSINNGLTWNTISTYLTSSYSSFTQITANIPPAAMTASTMFRWNQPNSSGTGSDNWAIDDVSINIGSGSSNFLIEWRDDNNQVVSTNPILGYTPPASTMFYVILTDTVANCQTIDSVYLTINTFSLEVGNDTLLCPNANMQIFAQTTLTNPVISWSNAGNLLNSNTLSPVIINDISQYYTLSLTQGTCFGKDSIFVDYYQRPNIIDTTLVNICVGDTFDLHLNGGSNYAWDNNAFVLNAASQDPQFINQANTLFIVDFEFGNNCLSEDSIQINVSQIPTISMVDTIYKCPENSVTISPIFTNVLSVLWSNNLPTNNITVAQEGMYVVGGTNLCRTVYDSVLVIDFDVDQVDLGNDTTLCYYNSLNVSPGNLDAGTTFVWSNGNPNSTQVLTGTTTISIETTDINSCQSQDTLNVSIFPILNVSLGPDISFCSYDDVLLQLNNPNLVDFFWNTGDTTETITISDQGNYIVLTHDNNACSYVDTIFVDEIVPPFPVITGDLQYCPGQTTSLSLTANFSNYLWSTQQTTPSISVGAPGGTIWVKVLDQFNCMGMDSVQIGEIQLPDLDLGPDYFICPADFTQISSLITGGHTYQWSTTETSPIINVGPGTYDVELIYNTCTLRDTITILPLDPPQLQLEADYTICPDESITLSPLVAAYYDSIVWSDGTQNIPFIYNDNIIMFDTVFITATAYGCGQVTDSIAIYVENCNCIIYVPNTFTPDGNEFNNTFGITHLCDFLAFEFSIYNRWGELIFVSYDPNFAWDGTGPDGSVLQDGSYTWTMIYQSSEDATSINQSGTVTLLR